MESPYSKDEFSHRFLLHITPVDAHALPEYDIGHFYTGQVVRVERSTGEVSWTSPIWDNSYTFRNPAAELQSKLNPSPPADDQNTASGAELFAARSGSWHSSAAKQGAGPAHGRCERMARRPCCRLQRLGCIVRFGNPLDAAELGRIQRQSRPIRTGDRYG